MVVCKDPHKNNIQLTHLIEDWDLQKEIFVALAHRSMRIIGTFNRYFKEGKLLNRQKDISLFVDRLLLALRYLNEKDTLMVVEKLI